MPSEFSRMRDARVWIPWANGIGLSALLALVVVLLCYQVPYTYEYDLGSINTDAMLERFGGTEQGDPAFRWSLGESTIHFPDIAQNTDYVLTLRMAAGSRGDDAPEPLMQVRANGTLLKTIHASPDLNDYVLPISAAVAAAGRQLQITLTTTTFQPSKTLPGSRDARNLGVMVVSAQLQPNRPVGSPFAIPPPGLTLTAVGGVCLGYVLLRRTRLGQNSRLLWQALGASLALLAVVLITARIWASLYLWLVALLLLAAIPVVSLLPRWWKVVRAGNGLDFMHTLGIENVRVRRVLEIGLVALIVVSFLWFKLLPLRDRELSDFISYYAAAGVWLQGNDYYNYQRLQRFNNRHNLVEGLIAPFIYPPPTVLFMVPFATLGPADAKLVWLGLNFLLLLGSGLFLWLAMRSALPKPSSPVWLALMLAFSGSLENSLEFGQVGVLILFLFALGIWAWTSNRPWVSAATAIFGTLLKLFPALLFPYFAWKGDWRTVRASLVGGVGALAASLLVAGIGLGAWVTYVTQIIPPLSDVRASLFNQSLNASVRRILYTFGVSGENPFEGPQSVGMRVLTLSLSGALVLLAAWYMRRNRSIAPADRQIEYALIVVLVLLCVPLVWEHYLMWMILPLFVLLNMLMNRRMSWRAQALGLALGVSSYVFTQYAPNIIFATGTPPLLDSIGFFGNLLLFSALLGMLAHSQRAVRSGAVAADASPVVSQGVEIRQVRS